MSPRLPPGNIVLAQFREAAYSIKPYKISMNPTLKTSSFAKIIVNLGRIPVRNNGRQILLPIDHIEYIQAARNYSIIHGVNGKSWVTSKTLQDFDELLNASNQFLRLHRSHLVNISLMVDCFYEKEGFMVLLSNNKKLKVSRRHVKNVRSAVVNAG